MGILRPIVEGPCGPVVDTWHDPPQPALLAADRNDDRIKMPLFAELAGRTPTDGERPPEFLRPQMNRLMGDDDASSHQHIRDHPQAQWKAEIEPHRVGNDFSGKAMAAVERSTVNHALLNSKPR